MGKRWGLSLYTRSLPQSKRGTEMKGACLSLSVWSALAKRLSVKPAARQARSASPHHGVIKTGPTIRRYPNGIKI